MNEILNPPTCKFLENFKGRTATAISPKELLDLLRSNDVVSSIDTGGKVFTEQQLDKLLDRSDMLTSPRESDVTNKDGVVTNNNSDVNTTNDDNNNNDISLTKNKTMESNTVECEENIEKNDTKSNGEKSLFKVIGVSNSEDITF